MSRTIIATDAAPAALGPYSQGVVTGSLLFTAGQLGLDPQSGKFVSDDVAEQATKALENAREVVQAGGMTLADVVKVTVFLADMNDFGAVNEVYKGFFDADPPARSAVEVARLPIDARVEIEMIASRG
jgi:2-iminobutanoate/2-iminopropanoate deaminase